MIQATVNLNLDHLLETDHGAAAFEAQLQREFSEENLAFWQAVREYRAIEGGPARLTRAREIDTEFVQEGSMRQVNLPSGLVAKFTTALAACESEAPVDIFDAASDEVFRLMERDTFSRFKSDPSALSNLVDGYYAAAAAASGSAGKKDGAEPDLITFRQFREWALKEPAVLIFFTGLCTSVKRILSENIVSQSPAASVDA